ncbi:MAG: squalene/phytoene synthase family protein [Rhodobacteraceae bacterium]|nr:squalene/phytoene synthase family protein [Paracoccaceae bacterium]
MNARVVAEIVQSRDPDRFLSAHSAPAPRRRHLFAIYGFNSEVSRAAWVTNEPMLARIRLQWWKDAVNAICDGHDPPKHEVALELARTISTFGFRRTPFEEVIEARASDVDAPDGACAGGFDSYINSTSGNVMWLAALALGAPNKTEDTIRDFAWGAGVAAYVRALPELVERGRAWIDPADSSISGLLLEARERITAARSNRRSLPRYAAPALLAGWRASSTLDRAISNPGLIAAGRLAESEFRRRGVLAWRSATGLW